MRRSLAVKKRIDHCPCIFIWSKLGTSFGRVNKLIKKFKTKLYKQALLIYHTFNKTGCFFAFFMVLTHIVCNVLLKIMIKIYEEMHD